MNKVILFLSLLIISFYAKSQSAWSLEKNESGIKIYTREIAGSSLKEYRAETSIKTSLNALLAVLDDASNHKQWLYDCTESKRLKTVNVFEGYNYYIQHTPWPLTNRDMITKYKVTQDAVTKAITIQLTGSKDYIPETDNVRVPKLNGFWQFIPQSNKEIKVIYQLHSEPGGSVSASLANAFVVDIPFNTILNLKKMVMIDKYKNKISKDIIEP